MSGQSTQPDSPAERVPPVRRTLRLDLEYDGTDYAGWQLQAEQETIQGVVQRAVRAVLDDPAVHVVAAGRTDSGVHAVGQVAHVRTTSQLPAFKILAGTNAGLRRDVRIRAVSEASQDFHARHSAVRREYRYQIWDEGPVPPFLHRYCHESRRRLDSDAMRAAASLLIGDHDFTSFRGSQCTAPSPIRTIQGATVERSGPIVVFAIQSKAFLHHMVRNLAGALIEIGRGRLSATEFKSVLAARDRRVAPAMASARGLFLYRIDYAAAEGPVVAPVTPVVGCTCPHL